MRGLIGMCSIAEMARAVSSTRYVIFRAYLVEHFTRRPGPAIGNIFEALPDALGRAGFRGEIEQVLIGFGVLDHGGSFSIHRQNERALSLAQVAQKLRRVIAERGHWLNVLGDVHGAAFSCYSIIS